MRAGQLRQEVTIQYRDETARDHGAITPTWRTFAIVRAGVIPLTGNELESARQIVGSVTHRVEMRYLSGITPKKRLLYNGRILEIDSVVNQEERDRELILMCSERDPDT